MNNATKQSRIDAAATINLDGEPFWAASARECLAGAVIGGPIGLKDYETGAALHQGVGADELLRWVIKPLRDARLLAVATQKRRKVLMAA